MAPKKRSFHTPRNTKNATSTKTNEKKCTNSNEEVNKNLVINSNLSAEVNLNQKDKYSKRTLESNWAKYEEPISDPHTDLTRGQNFDVLLSYSGGSGSQLKLQDEKQWEDEFVKDISLHIPDLINAVKCIPFHERIGLRNIFDEKTVLTFIENSKKSELSYKTLSQIPVSERKDHEKTVMNSAFDIIKEPDVIESEDEDDDDVIVKNITVQDKTEHIINSLASSLCFRNFPEKEENAELPVAEDVEEVNPDATSNDLDFLLSLNISTNSAVKEKSVTALKSANVDDWLNSLLED